MSSLLGQISQDLNLALKARDEVSVSTLRFLLSGIHNAKIAKGSELSDPEVLTEIAREAKRHKESIEAFEKAGREELASKEKAELGILQKYLPEQLTEEEISKVVLKVIAEVGATGAGDIGKVMGIVMARVKGKADGGVVSEIVKGKLSS
jgi:uncharacterized protein